MKYIISCYLVIGKCYKHYSYAIYYRCSNFKMFSTKVITETRLSERCYCFIITVNRNVVIYKIFICSMKYF